MKKGVTYVLLGSIKVILDDGNREANSVATFAPPIPPPIITIFASSRAFTHGAANAKLEPSINLLNIRRLTVKCGPTVLSSLASLMISYSPRFKLMDNLNIATERSVFNYIKFL